MYVYMGGGQPYLLVLKKSIHCFLICSPLHSDLRSVNHTPLPAKPVTHTRSDSGCWAKNPLLWLVQTRQITVPGSLGPPYLLSELAPIAAE